MGLNIGWHLPLGGRIPRATSGSAGHVGATKAKET